MSKFNEFILTIEAFMLLSSKMGWYLIFSFGCNLRFPGIPTTAWEIWLILRGSYNMVLASVGDVLGPIGILLRACQLPFLKFQENRKLFFYIFSNLHSSNFCSESSFCFFLGRKISKKYAALLLAHVMVQMNLVGKYILELKSWAEASSSVASSKFIKSNLKTVFPSVMEKPSRKKCSQARDASGHFVFLNKKTLQQSSPSDFDFKKGFLNGDKEKPIF